MIRTLASLLLLGAVSPPPAVFTSPALPGAEIIRVASPAPRRLPMKDLSLSASGVLLIDMESGYELLSVNPEVPRPMASLTKIMTAMVILENHRLDERVTIPAIAENINGSAIGLRPGEHLTVESLLKALLIPSANDAAYSLAVFHAKGTAAFVQQMNERARMLGLNNTSFANPAGLDNVRQYSTPRDLAWLTIAVWRKPDFRRMAGMRSASISSLERTSYELRNTNEMLHYNADVLGAKTGTTRAAGECLIIVFTEGDRQYLLVLLNSARRYADAVSVLRAFREASL